MYPFLNHQIRVALLEKIPIGISSCLLGKPVRFDGGHKHDRYISQTLGEYFSWQSICPEVELGLGTPRPTLRLEGKPQNPRLIQTKSRQDITEKMRRFSSQRVRKLSQTTIYGYLLKSKSPSCGMDRIKIYREPNQRPHTNGRGVFADQLMTWLPNLPIEEEGRLCDPGLRENWISRVFTYHAFRNRIFPYPTANKLVRFHSEYKFVLLSHNQQTYRQLGRLIGQCKGRSLKAVAEEYETLMMKAMKKPATPANHVNVMQHLLGFFKASLNSKARQEISSSITDYRRGFLPILVPITLIKHYANLQDIEYLQQQAYLNPHPKELALRSQL